MRIADRFGEASPVFSFEFFPPKTPAGEKALRRAIDGLRALEPAFVSVTYGAGGSTRQKTIEIVSHIKRDFGIEAMAHLTCVGHSRDEIAGILGRLRAERVENILALRGDPAQGQETFVRPENGFGFANELVEFINAGYDFCLGAAGYPEGHTECRDLDADIRHLRAKVDAGAEFIITQLFYDNADYFAFVERARKVGIAVPLLPGIMPITDRPQIERIAQLCGARIPAELRDRLLAADQGEAAQAIGVAWAIEQCRELLEGGAPGIHFYTLNKSPATTAILEELKS